MKINTSLRFGSGTYQRSSDRRIQHRPVAQTGVVVSLLLSITFACGVVIAVSHVLNRPSIAPVYDVAANLVAFGCAMAASLMLGHRTPALLSAVAGLCWLGLARRTYRSRRRDRSPER